MNAAARARVDQDVLDLSMKPLYRRFSTFLKSSSSPARSAAVRWAPRGQDARTMILQRWLLANGHEGLVAQELQEEAPPKGAIPPHGVPGAARMPSGGPDRLTEEELKAFQAIGSEIRRLSREKERRFPGEPSPSSPAPAATPAGKGAAADFMKPFLAAFDATFLLDERYALQKLAAGKVHRLGLRWQSIKGRSVRETLMPQSLGAFERMTARLSDSKTGVAKEAVLLNCGSGAGLPFRAVLGLWPGEGGKFFLAFVSLEMPSRVKRQLTAAATARRAA